MNFYCLGFAFAGDDSGVLLIKKNKPAWMRGKRNGLGGKIEVGERSDDAMAREFFEECGVKTNRAEWLHVADLRVPNPDPGCVVKIYALRLPWARLDNFQSTTDEEVGVYDVDEVKYYDPVPNLAWMIPMAKTALDAGGNWEFLTIQ